MEIEFQEINGLVPYEQNARVHSQQQLAEIANSILEWGWTNPILVDGTRIVAGHGRLEAAKLLREGGSDLRMASGQPIPVGKVPTINCDQWTDEQRRAYILADNKLAENATWDKALLAQEVEELLGNEFDIKLSGFSDSDLADLFDTNYHYEKSIGTPQYVPTGDEPAISQLCDNTKTRQLMNAIDAADIPEDVAAFLTLAAQRHLVFDYGKIAEYYCHAPPEVQRLFEDSALVIIDVNDAIEHGYVQMSERFSKIYDEQASAHA